MLKIEHKLFSSDDIENFINLSIDDELRSQGMKKPEIIEWKFIKNPLGPSNYFYFKVNEKVLGRILSAHYPGKLAINQRIKNSFCLSDLYIHKSYRQLSNLKNLYLN